MSRTTHPENDLPISSGRSSVVGGQLWRLILLAVALAVSAGAPVRAQTSVTVPLMLMGDSNPDGTAILTVEGEGTEVTLEIGGLEPGVTAEATMHAGTCRAPGASGAQLPPLTAGDDGRATSAGMILFRGTENVPLRDIADGAHSISIGDQGMTIACGTIPDLATVGEQPQPFTPTAPWWTYLRLLVLFLVLAAAAAITFRNREGRARRWLE
jgi:hypothetical protein